MFPAADLIRYLPVRQRASHVPDEYSHIHVTLLLTQAEDDLRERYFGDFELSSDEHYALVWECDAEDPHQEPEGRHV